MNKWINKWNSIKQRKAGTVTRLIRELNWQPLQKRWEKARMLLFFKISRGIVAIPMPSYIQPPHYSRTRQYHPARYAAVNCGTNPYKGNFFPATMNSWYSLPPEVITQLILKGFKAGLRNVYMNWFLIWSIN